MLTILGRVTPKNIQQSLGIHSQRIRLGTVFSTLDLARYTYHLCTIPPSYQLLKVAPSAREAPELFYGPLPRLILLVGISKYGIGNERHAYCAGITMSKAATLNATSQIFRPFTPNSFWPEPRNYEIYIKKYQPAKQVLTGICGTGGVVTDDPELNGPQRIEQMCAHAVLRLVESTYRIRGDEAFLSHPLLAPYQAMDAWTWTCNFFTTWESMTHDELNALDWGVYCTLQKLMELCFIEPVSDSNNRRGKIHGEQPERKVSHNVRERRGSVASVGERT